MNKTLRKKRAKINKLKKQPELKLKGIVAKIKFDLKFGLIEAYFEYLQKTKK